MCEPLTQHHYTLALMDNKLWGKVSISGRLQSLQRFVYLAMFDICFHFSLFLVVFACTLDALDVDALCDLHQMVVFGAFDNNDFNVSISKVDICKYVSLNLPISFLESKNE